MVFLWSYFLCTLSSQNSRVAGTSGGDLVQHLCSSRAIESWLPRTMPRWLLSISKVEDYNLSGQPVAVLGHSNS